MIIALSGTPGSGKSTVGKKLADHLGWPRYYIGGIRREMARKRGITLGEYNKLGETDPSTDREPDEYQKKLGETHDNFIIEGRTSWYFIPHAFKIFLDVDEHAGAERVWKELQKENTRNEAAGLQSVEDVLQSHRERKHSDALRYKAYYNIDAYDPKQYDVVIDTTSLNPDQVFNEVLKTVKKAIDKRG